MPRHAGCHGTPATPKGVCAPEIHQVAGQGRPWKAPPTCSSTQSLHSAAPNPQLTTQPVAVSFMQCAAHVVTHHPPPRPLRAHRQLCPHALWRLGRGWHEMRPRHLRVPRLQPLRLLLRLCTQPSRGVLRGRKDGGLQRSRSMLRARAATGTLLALAGHSASARAMLRMLMAALASRCHRVR